MSKHDVLYRKKMTMAVSSVRESSSGQRRLFDRELSESEESQSDNDKWDDSLLNNAYNRALKMGNVDVAKRLAMATNSSPTFPRQIKVIRNKWSAGMLCRAVYEEDGIEYEALVVKIINDRDCVVKFLEKRKKRTPIKKNKHRKPKHFHFPKIPLSDLNKLRNMASTDIPFPMPPLHELPSRSSLEDEDSTVSTMLLAWYMSGYYTGIYQGLKRSKVNKRRRD